MRTNSNIRCEGISLINPIGGIKHHIRWPKYIWCVKKNISRTFDRLKIHMNLVVYKNAFF